MKVAIVGACIAGPTLAYWLWRYGHELDRGFPTEPRWPIVNVPRGDLAAMIYSLAYDQVEIQFSESVSAITQADGVSGS